jgi:hypothetical protein
MAQNPLNNATGSVQAGQPTEGPGQEEVHADINSLSLNGTLGNTDGSTSRKLAKIAGSLGSLTFKDTVGNDPAHVNGQPEYVLPPDVELDQFLAFIKDVTAAIGEDNVAVNTAPDAQAATDYQKQPKFFVRRVPAKL